MHQGSINRAGNSVQQRIRVKYTRHASLTLCDEHKVSLSLTAPVCSLLLAGSSNLVPMPPPASSPEPKRRRRGRVRFTDEQVQSLERRFREEQYLPASERNQLATSMELSESQVKTWFQNRRAKTKRALKRLRKVRAAQTAFNAGRQVPNVNIATTTWMNSSPAAMASSGSPYAFQQMQFGVDAIPSPPVSMATPMEAYLYCSPTESSTVAYPSQPTVPSANPHPQFVVGGLAVAGDTGHRHHMSPAYHASSNQVLPQYNDYMHVPLTTRTQRAASSDGPGSAVPLVRSGYTMPYVQLGDQPTYQHRHL